MLRAATIALCALLVRSQPVPLPNLPDGWRVGTSGPVVETFMDMLCPDCAGDWPTLTALRAHYGPRISFILHTFPLPYHTFAFRAAQGAHVVASLNATAPALAVFDYAATMFANQAGFYDASLSTTGANALIASLAAKLGYSQAAVLAGLADDNINEATRVSWKYATSRYTTGTPHYLVNGLPVDDQLGAGALADWIALIDPLLAGARAPTAPTLKRFTSKDL